MMSLDTRGKYSVDTLPSPMDTGGSPTKKPSQLSVGIPEDSLRTLPLDAPEELRVSEVEPKMSLDSQRMPESVRSPASGKIESLERFSVDSGADVSYARYADDSLQNYTEIFCKKLAAHTGIVGFRHRHAE